MNAFQRLLHPSNLNYAWAKAKRQFNLDDGYVDRGEIAEFELDLERRLKKIHKRFASGSYYLTKLKPLPRPKKYEGQDPINRQYYHVAIDDQVAWIALVNVLGPELDKLMPAWSYGNRIFRNAWYELDEDESSSVLEIGPYRHSSGHLYRKFQHSWPLFRRHVALTARKMVRSKKLDETDLDQADQLALAAGNADRLLYLSDKFWRRSQHARSGTEIYHASIDLKQFYPNVSHEAILRGIGMAGDEFAIGEPLYNLIEQMLRFRLDAAKFPIGGYKNVEPRFSKGKVRGIPTGLYVAGFLANVAMLPVDQIVDNALREKRAIAHFRFVDDHTILSYDFDELCEWIDWYCDLIKDKTGVDVNVDKFDPQSLGAWISRKSKGPDESLSSKLQKTKDAAIDETRMDGANPTKLLTKTLAQVSAIAGTNVDILDDSDLIERLQQLEWLLLADLPEREIRPDTRAAFAAGRIAALAPLLIQEGDGLIDEARNLAELINHPPNESRSSDLEKERYKQELDASQSRVAKYTLQHEEAEERHLRHCFNLLMQAFREFPGKARLFIRLHQFCRTTGYDGLHELGSWIENERNKKNHSWADYYAGYSLQLLASGVLQATKTLSNENALRSEQRAAFQYLDNVTRLNIRAYSVPARRACWYHDLSNIELAVSLLAVKEDLPQTENYSQISDDLAGLANDLLDIELGASFSEWIEKTGRTAGVWAHHTESRLSQFDAPTNSWRKFETSFLYKKIPDRRAARRYPEILTDRGWDYFLTSVNSLPEDDSGWIREAIMNNRQRILEARKSKRAAFVRAAKSMTATSESHLTLNEWTEFLQSKCSPFDPRCSEWTALEICRQLIEPVAADFRLQSTEIRHLHPHNVLIPRQWIEEFPVEVDARVPSWEQWRNLARGRKEEVNSVKLRTDGKVLLDYRYFMFSSKNRTPEQLERMLIGIGRILIGQLRFDYTAPRLWNQRGNERISDMPRMEVYQSLAVSSPTLLLLEACLGGRSAETREIDLMPEFFGLTEDDETNDIEFDPPILFDARDVYEALENAQEILEGNQLSVSMNDPRQMIPFQMSEFATGSDGHPDEDEVDE